MKKYILLFVCIISVHSYGTAQNLDSLIASKLLEASSYLKGSNGKLVNADMALKLYKECAEYGSATALNAVGTMYLFGKGIDQNSKEALIWFKKAAQQNNARAYYNIGLMFRSGDVLPLNYDSAYLYFTKAADGGIVSAIYGQGYMCYKGLGCKQDYAKAFQLFSKSASLKKVNAMYFLGLCYRNGYGTNTNIDSANYWLKKAARLGYTMAKDELATSEPENIALAGNLAEKVKAAQAIAKKTVVLNKYVKIEHSIPANQIEGNYTGYLLKYDWSWQHVVLANKLNISLTYEKDTLRGVWTEDDTLDIPIKAVLTPKALVFSGMQYRKKDHYNPNAELLTFEKARFQFVNDSNSSYLGGDLQLYSPNRKEPSKPHYIALVKTTQGSDSNKLINYTNEDGSLLNVNTLRAYPNPFTNIIIIDFELKQTTNVTTQLVTLDGKLIYSNDAGKLDAGSYTLPLQTQQVSAGTYLVRLLYGKKLRTVKLIKL